MSVQIETLVFCDGCSCNCDGDDRSSNAALIRAARKQWGWIRVGSLDYCEDCAKEMKLAKKEKRKPKFGDAPHKHPW